MTRKKFIGSTLLGASILASCFAFAKVDLYEVESFDPSEGWKIAPAREKSAGSKVLVTEGGGENLEKVFVSGAGVHHLWVRMANLSATNAPPSKVVVQFNGESTTVVASGKQDSFLWQKAGTSMLPAGYNAVSISPVQGVKAALDCVIVTDEKEFVPPSDEESLSKLRKMANNH